MAIGLVAGLGFGAETGAGAFGFGVVLGLAGVGFSVVATGMDTALRTGTLATGAASLAFFSFVREAFFSALTVFLTAFLASLRAFFSSFFAALLVSLAN